MARPQKDPSEKFRTPARQLGRVSDERWESLQKAAFMAGKSFTEWALAHLEAAAEREKKSKKNRK